MNKEQEKERQENFKIQLRKEGRSPHTIIAYQSAVRLYGKLYENITIDNLKEFKKYLIKHYAPNTANLRICAMNHYVTFLEKNGELRIGRPENFDIEAAREKAANEESEKIEENNAESAPLYMEDLDEYRLPCVKVQKKPFMDNIISEEDYELMKRRLKEDGNMFWYFVVWLLTATGARVSELVQLKVEHLQLGYMDLCSKGGKVRRIYIPDKLVDEALAWLKEKGIRSGFIILNQQGVPMTPRGINFQLKKFAVDYGIDPTTVYAHSFRHRFAKNFLERYQDISLLADLMGHDNIETTRIYLKKSSKELRDLLDEMVTW